MLIQYSTTVQKRPATGNRNFIKMSRKERVSTGAVDGQAHAGGRDKQALLGQLIGHSHLAKAGFSKTAPGERIGKAVRTKALQSIWAACTFQTVPWRDYGGVRWDS